MRCWLLLLLVPLVGQSADYDADLCVLAQEMIVGAPPGAFAVRVVRGEGEGFHSIQMDADARGVTVAMTAGSVSVDDAELATFVACKMVNQARVNDVLGLELRGAAGSCRRINEHTYALALAGLSEAEQARYLTEGRKIHFTNDYVAASGGEWLPSKVEDFIQPASDGLQVTAPAVRVPWDPVTREFYQGTNHCKLITQSAMQYWMRQAAFVESAQLIPTEAESCAEPTSMTSDVGSCLFWFAPAQAMFCQDYSGAGWNKAAARDACAKRHASPEALKAAGSRYEGAGGIFSASGCAQRADAPTPQTTCVFHCQADDETLWHTLAANENTPAAAGMMQRACDLFIE